MFWAKKTRGGLSEAREPTLCHDLDQKSMILKILDFSSSFGDFGHEVFFISWEEGTLGDDPAGQKINNQAATGRAKGWLAWAENVKFIPKSSKIKKK